MVIIWYVVRSIYIVSLYVHLVIFPRALDSQITVYPLFLCNVKGNCNPKTHVLLLLPYKHATGIQRHERYAYIPKRHNARASQPNEHTRRREQWIDAAKISPHKLINEKERSQTSKSHIWAFFVTNSGEFFSKYYWCRKIKKVMNLQKSVMFYYCL